MAEETWHEARLIPTSGISGADEQERRATSALLAVLTAVREFGRSLLQPLGAPAGNVAIRDTGHRRPAAARRNAEGTAAETSARLRRSEAVGRAERPTLRCITPSPAACQHLRRVAGIDDRTLGLSPERGP